MDQQEISDRLEIQDLLARYCYAIDRRRLDELDTIFTPDAVIDYTAFGAPRAGLEEMKGFLAEALGMHSAYYHLAATSRIELSGDTAECHTICHNPMVLSGGEGGKDLFYMCGLWYHDRLVRTPEGWRIAERIEEKCYMVTLPGARLS
ncbi:MAG TPA: nuclear transport factor 2 family protein [Acidimicrobiales bacterium]|nr:nuclear transport factor 2 family protein [Acidimicrobiales bacterium]